MTESPTELQKRLQQYVNNKQIPLSSVQGTKPPTYRECLREVREVAGLSLVGWWLAGWIVRLIITNMAKRLLWRYENIHEYASRENGAGHD